MTGRSAVLLFQHPRMTQVRRIDFNERIATFDQKKAIC